MKPYLSCISDSVASSVILLFQVHRCEWERDDSINITCLSNTDFLCLGEH